jgi:1,4-alpha-glucan branching enzyme
MLVLVQHYHADGLRGRCSSFDALYLDYSRNDGWNPNIYGGNENLDTISFLRNLMKRVYLNYEGVQTIAEKHFVSDGFQTYIRRSGIWYEMR